jgi:hypothetical protein
VEAIAARFCVVLSRAGKQTHAQVLNGTDIHCATEQSHETQLHAYSWGLQTGPVAINSRAKGCHQAQQEEFASLRRNLALQQ